MTGVIFSSLYFKQFKRFISSLATCIKLNANKCSVAPNSGSTPSVMVPAEPFYIVQMSQSDHFEWVDLGRRWWPASPPLSQTANQLCCHSQPGKIVTQSCCSTSPNKCRFLRQTKPTGGSRASGRVYREDGNARDWQRSSSYMYFMHIKMSFYRQRTPTPLVPTHPRSRLQIPQGWPTWEHHINFWQREGKVWRLQSRHTDIWVVISL